MNHFYKTSIFLITNFILLFGGIVHLCSADDIWSESRIITIKEHAGSYYTPCQMSLDSSGTIHIIYKNSVSGNGVYYLTKTRCDNWSDHELILEGGLFYQMHIDNQDTLHLIWSESENIAKNNYSLSKVDYFYSFKKINGSWSNPESFFTGYSRGWTFGESFVVDDLGILHVVISCGDMQEPFNQDPDFIKYEGLYYLYRTTNAQWSDVELLTADLTRPCITPSLTIDKRGILHLVYNENDGSNGIYYQFRTKKNGWSIRELTLGNNQSAWNPFITSDTENTIHVVFWIHSGVVYINKTLNGIWSDVIKISINETSSPLLASPKLAVDRNKNKHFLWKEKVPNNSSNNYDLLYRYKPNNESWSAPEIICNQGPNNPHLLSIELDHEGNAYVIWEETGNLYFRTTWVNNAPSVSIQTENIQKRYTKTTYDFNGKVTDDENCNDVYYFIDWGDGNNSGWIGPLNNKNIFQTAHAWYFTGNYTVKIKAKDIQGKESNWSDTLIIRITDEKTPGFELFPFLLALIMIILWKKKIIWRKK